MKEVIITGFDLQVYSETLGCTAFQLSGGGSRQVGRSTGPAGTLDTLKV